MSDMLVSMLAMSYKKLQIWSKSMDLARKAYTVTQSFPQQEQYGLISQIRRCAVSVPSNIAEGSQRSSDKEFANFILIARGSLAELETQLILAHDFQYINDKVYEECIIDIDELSRMLHAFHSKLKANRS